MPQHLADIVPPYLIAFNNRIVSTVLKNINCIISNLSVKPDVPLLSQLNLKLEKICTKIVGITSTIDKECNEEDAKVLLVDIRKAIQKIRRTYELLEMENFFNDTNTRNVSEKVLDVMYNLEFILRKKAFKNKKVSACSPEAEITARLQLQAQ